MKYKLGKLKLKSHFLGHTSHILITCVALVTVLASAHHRFSFVSGTSVEQHGSRELGQQLDLPTEGAVCSRICFSPIEQKNDFVTFK